MKYGILPSLLPRRLRRLANEAGARRISLASLPAASAAEPRILAEWQDNKESTREQRPQQRWNQMTLEALGAETEVVQQEPDDSQANAHKQGGMPPAPVAPPLKA